MYASRFEARNASSKELTVDLWPVICGVLIDGDRVISLLTVLICAGPARAEDTDSDTDTEFSFLEESEDKQARIEADRAPSASIFLEDEEDELSAEWQAPDSGEPFEDDDLVLERVDDLEEDIERGPDAMEMDPIEDMDGLGPDMSRMEPLGDHFALTVSRSDLGSTVAELPLLVARGPQDLRGDLWIVADFYLDGRKVSESRHFYTPASASELGPTYAWLKTSIPVFGPGGIAEVRVFAAPPGKKEALLFVRTTPFTN